LNVVSWLVEHTVLRDDGRRLGRALVWACRSGRLNVVTWLVEHTALRDDSERLEEAMVWACKSAEWNIVKWLVINTQVQVDVNHCSVLISNRIMHHVISFNTNTLSWLRELPELCRRVFMCGEDVNVQDNYNGDTLLHKTCSNAESDSAGALLLAGADEAITNDSGQTPVQVAAIKGHVDLWSLLDVSSEWKLLVRSHRLRRRTAIRVMMTLIKWRVQQTRNMWTRP
jgi:ankyrin repeat protein